ncbi:MAG TPA: histidine phosphatase family protein [Bacteroidia bacterium]|jgi:broad specificity phosphatase PhoE|nr:histidine phosphatase family protein [Bacteroidia bacterium]
MADLSKKIAEARADGYGDDAILNFISQSQPDMASKIQAARGDGYKDTEIVNHLFAPATKTGFFGRLEENLNPLPLASALLKHPIGTAQSIVTPNKDVAKEASDAFNKGNYGRAALSTVEDIPLLGPLIRQAEQDIRNDDYGALAGTVASGVLLHGATKTFGALRNAGITPGSAAKAAAEAALHPKVAIMKGAANLLDYIAKGGEIPPEGTPPPPNQTGTPPGIMPPKPPTQSTGGPGGPIPATNPKLVKPPSNVPSMGPVVPPVKPAPTGTGLPPQPTQATSVPSMGGSSTVNTRVPPGIVQPPVKPAPPVGGVYNQGVMAEGATGPVVPNDVPAQPMPTPPQNGSGPMPKPWVAPAAQVLQKRMQSPPEPSMQPPPNRGPAIPPPGNPQDLGNAMRNVLQRKQVPPVTPQNGSVLNTSPNGGSAAEQLKGILAPGTPPGRVATIAPPAVNNGPIIHEANSFLKTFGDSLKEQGATLDDLKTQPDKLSEFSNSLDKMDLSEGARKIVRDKLGVPPTPPPGMAGGGVIALAKGGVVVPDKESIPDMARSGQDVIRGSFDIPLSKKGLEQARELGDRFKAKGGVDSIEVSNLHRAVQTAEAISKAIGVPISKKVKDLRPWALGSIEGQPTMKVLDKIHNYIIKQPNVKVPGMGEKSTSPGESFVDFKRRTLGGLKKRLQELKSKPTERKALITHYRDLRLAQSWAAKGFPDSMEINSKMMTQKGDDPPTSVHRLHWVGSKPKMEKIDMKSNSKLPGGLYLVRHGATLLNGTDSKGNPI